MIYHVDTVSIDISISTLAQAYITVVLCVS
jgi:hypothetical protein